MTAESPTKTSLSAELALYVRIPFPSLSSQPVMGRPHQANIGYPSTTRLLVLICAGVPPRSRSRFLFAEALIVRSTAHHSRSTIWPRASSSNPAFIVAPRFRRTLVAAPTDGATIAEISASLVLL